MLTLLLATLALAAPERPPVTLAATLAPGLAPPSLGVLGAVHFAWHPGRFGVGLSGREGWWFGHQTLTSTLALTGRARLSEVVHVQVGVAHQHEAPLDLLKEDAVGALAGTAHGLHHRNGLTAGVGGDWPLPIGGQRRWRWRVELGATYFPDRHGRQVHAWLEHGIAFDVGRRRAAADSFGSPDE